MGICYPWALPRDDLHAPAVGTLAPSCPTGRWGELGIPELWLQALPGAAHPGFSGPWALPVLAHPAQAGLCKETPPVHWGEPSSAGRKLTPLVLTNIQGKHIVKGLCKTFNLGAL